MSSLLDLMRHRHKPKPENPTEYPRWTEVADPEALAIYSAMRAKEEEANALDAQVQQVRAEYRERQRRLHRVLAARYTTIFDASEQAEWREFDGKLYYVGTDEE